MKHSDNCDTQDINSDGITKPCNCGSGEREGWTSASNAEADALCPGRHLAQRGIPEGPPGKDADSGNRIHDALAGVEIAWDRMSDDERETAEKCQEIERAVLDHVFGVEQPRTRCREVRLWLETRVFPALVTSRTVRHSGKPDVYYITGQCGLVCDYKTGRTEVTESARNGQLRDLAVLLAAAYDLKTVVVCVIQPWVTMTPEYVTYDADDIFHARGDMEARVIASNEPKAPRVAGFKQCQYCRAKSTCAEFKAQALPASAEQNLPEPAITACIRHMDGMKLGRFLALVRLAEATTEDEVRVRLNAGQIVDGWTLKEGRHTEKITDATTVANRAFLAGVTQEAFIRECVTVGKTALKAALKSATRAKGMALDAKLAEVLEGATETKISAPILTRL